MTERLMRWLAKAVERSRHFGSEPEVLKERKPSSEYTKSIFTRFVFGWAFRIIRTANFRPLYAEDFELVNPQRTVAAKYAVFQKAWSASKRRKSNYALLQALLVTYWSQLLYASFTCTFSACDCYFATNGNGPSLAKGVGLLFATATGLLITTIAKVHYENAVSLLGGEVKTLLGSLMFEKSFVLSPLATRKLGRGKKEQQRDQSVQNLRWTQGAIISSMNTNTDRVESCIKNMFNFLVLLPSTPLLIGMTYWLLGWPGPVGTSSIFFSIVAVTWIAKQLSTSRQRVNVFTERRVDLVNDIVNAVRFIKYCAWEDVFSKRYATVRLQEFRANTTMTMWRLTMYMSGYSIGNVPVVISTAIYVYLRPGNNTIRVIPFYFLSTIYRRLVLLAPIGIVELINGYHAINDIQEFLVAEEHQVGHGFKFDLEMDQGIVLDAARFTWEIGSTQRQGNVSEEVPKFYEVSDSSVQDFESHAPFQLKPLSISVGKGELLAVVGHVGSGKSSLAAAMIGDMVCIGGSVKMQSLPSYCPQSPWIQNASVRENIIFGRQYDASLFEQVVKVCAIDRDLAEMPDGDMTILGELGINISGGQKQRIQLARSLYQNRDIVILDDPLSAVDAHTGEHIFEQAICQHLAQRCRILVTQQLHILQRCHRIVWMHQGAVKATGTFQALCQIPGFVEFMGSCEQRLDEADAEPKVAKISSKQASNKEALRLMDDENISTQRLQWREYWQFLRLSKSKRALIIAFLSLLLNALANVCLSLSVSWWARGEYHGLSVQILATLVSVCLLVTWLAWGLMAYIIETGVLGSSALLSNRALDNVLTARMSFFDITPLGRILNIFTSDLNAIDVNYPVALSQLLFHSCLIVSLSALTVALVPLIASIFLPWILLATWVLNIYKRAPLQIKRLDRTYASFYVSKLAEGIVGRSHVRSCNREDAFIALLREAIDNLNSIHFTSYACQSWISVVQAWISLLLYLFAGFMVLLKRHSLYPGLSMVVLFSAEDLNSCIQSFFLLMTDVQRSMASVGRVGWYCTSIPQEPPRYAEISVIPEVWPIKAHIQFKNVAMRYRPKLPLVLKDLSFEIKPGERVGIVGRTGAGKSSILATLTRAVELADGCIMIDGVDISQVGLHKLRQQIAVIPQDPTLFQGTIRTNLIPDVQDEEEKGDRRNGASIQSDERDSLLLDALAKSFLIPQEAVADQVSEKDLGILRSRKQHLLNLDSPVSSGGSNLSHGERQLLMIARAIVRDSPVVLCDEATSAIDPETDAKVQESMRLGFAGKTFISIAHRISTIVNFDKIVVLASGRVVECGSPRELYALPDGFFRSLCVRSKVTIPS